MENKVSYIDKAVENFFENTLEVACQTLSSEGVDDIYTTQIKITHLDREYDFYLCMRESMLLILSQKLLFEDNPDQDTLIDLLNESANLIIGNAKVLWEEAEGAELILTTPEYQGFFEKSFSKELDKKLFFSASDEPIMIGIQTHTSKEMV